jgi:hypothetical protein
LPEALLAARSLAFGSGQSAWRRASFLIDSLEAGWTTDRERRAVGYLQGLAK